MLLQELSYCLHRMLFATGMMSKLKVGLGSASAVLVPGWGSAMGARCYNLKRALELENAPVFQSLWLCNVAGYETGSAFMRDAKKY